MWIGGYDDWTPAEQREWDRDIEEMRAEREQREGVMKTENADNLSWLQMAIDCPLFKATYTKIGDRFVCGRSKATDYYKTGGPQLSF